MRRQIRVVTLHTERHLIRRVLSTSVVGIGCIVRASASMLQDILQMSVLKRVPEVLNLGIQIFLHDLIMT